VSRSIAYLASIIDDFNMSSDLSGVTDDHSSYREALGDSGGVRDR
jgi:hypothetical protein